jgi:RNA polymerase sigma-70 factor (ECF subfamily)
VWSGDGKKPTGKTHHFDKKLQPLVGVDQFDATIGRGNVSDFVATRLPLPLSKNGNPRALAVSDQATYLAEITDEALMALICDGDREALASLFRRYARIVRGVAYRVLRDPSESDDLLQDIFLLIHRLCRNFDSSKSPARFWILQLTYHRAISRRRYLDSRQFYTRRDLDDVGRRLEASSVSTERYEDTIDGMFGKGISQKMFEALSENQRETLRLFFFEGYTLDEIASALGQSRVNIKHHYFRGLDKLRRDIFGLKLRGDQQYDKRLHPS